MANDGRLRVRTASGFMDVAAAVAECGRRSQGLATTEKLLAAGVAGSSLRAAVRAGAAHRVYRRVYSCLPLPGWTRFVVTDEGTAAAYVAHVRAVLLSLGDGAVASGRTAAALRGWPMLVEPSRTVEVCVPHGSRRTRLDGSKVTQRRDLVASLTSPLADADPLPVTTAVQTVLDCCRTLPTVEAVVIADSALRAGDVTLDALRSAARALPGVRDSARARRMIELADPEAGSVLESVLRVRMVLDAIAGFSTQLTISDRSRRFRVDFAFERERVVIEVDGNKWHQDADRDRTRDNRLAAMGWRVLRYRWAEVVHEPESVLAEIRETVGLGPSDCQFSGLPARSAA
jgi:very-short-patch-repair endonuclease